MTTTIQCLNDTRTAAPTLGTHGEPTPPDASTSQAMVAAVERPSILTIGRGEDDVVSVHRALDALGAQIESAPDGEEACALMDARPYDLIVLLPSRREDGSTDLCRRVRGVDGDIPIVILAIVGTDAAVLAGFAAGADAYLVAPIHVEELRARVAALLRRRARRRPTPPDHVDRARAEANAREAHGRTRGVGAARLDATLGVTRRALAVGISPVTRRTRVIAAAALIATGILADRAFQASEAPVAAATTTITTTRTATTSVGTVSVTASDAVTERAFALASPSVVSISNAGVGSSSGVIYDRAGDIVTNAHVVSGAQTLTVTLNSGKTYTATIVGADTADDLAVIHINATGLTAARFATSRSDCVAETVLAIGSPLGLKQSVTAGLISALGRTVQESTGAYLPDAIQTSAAINPGNSGGALVNLAGAVVGIPTLEATDSQNNNGGAAQGIGFAVPSTGESASLTLTRDPTDMHCLMATGVEPYPNGEHAPDVAVLRLATERVSCAAQAPYQCQ